MKKEQKALTGHLTAAQAARGAAQRAAIQLKQENAALAAAQPAQARPAHRRCESRVYGVDFRVFNGRNLLCTRKT